VVRIGTTTFALRRHEVETVWVELAREGSPT
jgi:Fe2+ transport system protein FeoA